MELHLHFGDMEFCMTRKGRYQAPAKMRGARPRIGIWKATQTEFFGKQKRGCEAHGQWAVGNGRLFHSAFFVYSVYQDLGPTREAGGWQRHGATWGMVITSVCIMRYEP